jgi:hypothetical protein
LFEKYRKIVLGAGMIGVYGRIQREGDIVHLVAHRLTELSVELASVGDRDAAFPLPPARGDEFHHRSRDEKVMPCTPHYCSTRAWASVWSLVPCQIDTVLNRMTELGRPEFKRIA